MKAAARAAGILIVAGSLFLSIAAGLYDVRAGLAVFGVCAIAAGVWNLTQE